MALLALAATLLAACAPRGQIVLVPEADAPGRVVEVLSATSRAPGDGTAIDARERSETLRYGNFRVAVPPQRAEGTVALPRPGSPDPATEFVVVAAEALDGEGAFLAAMNAGLARRPPAAREVAIFVHGFNTNFAEGLYRHAQMVHDFRSPGLSVFYSWPSAGNGLAYAFDRESALFARDGLERLATTVARSNARDFVLIGHSMGALVVMEAARQMAMRGSDRTLGKLQAVMLIAPDLDVDVFRGQAAELARRNVPIFVAVSGRDRALRISGLLRGGSERLGAVQSLDRVTDLPNVIIVDVTDVQGENDPLNHFAVVTSPEMIALFSGLDRFGTMMLRDQERPANVFEATVNVVAGVTQVALKPLDQ